jgi:hypothetical protein
VKAREVERWSYWGRSWAPSNYRETIALPRWEKPDPTDLEELTRWTARIIIFGGMAVAIIIIGVVALAFWAL